MALNNDDIARLTAIYRQAEKKLIRQIKKLDPKLSYTQNRKILLGNVRAIQRDLMKRSIKWTDEVVPKNYNFGSNGIIGQMRKAKELNIKINFTAADKDTLRALVVSTNLRFAETMQGITRTAQRALTTFNRLKTIDTIASGIGAGQGAKEIAKEIEKQFISKGITSLVDRSGRRWSMSRYSTMLARTSIMTARNDAGKLRLLQNGQRFAKVSRHADIDGIDICNQYENKIVDLTNPKIPSPPYHPNCRHVLQYARTSDLKRLQKAKV